MLEDPSNGWTKRLMVRVITKETKRTLGGEMTSFCKMYSLSMNCRVCRTNLSLQVNLWHFSPTDSTQLRKRCDRKGYSVAFLLIEMPFSLSWIAFFSSVSPWVTLQLLSCILFLWCNVFWRWHPFCLFHAHCPHKLTFAGLVVKTFSAWSSSLAFRMLSKWNTLL